MNQRIRATYVSDHENDGKCVQKRQTKYDGEKLGQRSKKRDGKRRRDIYDRTKEIYNENKGNG